MSLPQEHSDARGPRRYVAARQCAPYPRNRRRAPTRATSRVGRAIALLLGAGAVILLPHAAGAQTCPESEARVVSVQGTVEAMRAGAADWKPIALDEIYCPGDTIRVQAGSRADLSLADQTVMKLREKSTVELEPIAADDSVVLNLDRKSVVEGER